MTRRASRAHGPSVPGASRDPADGEAVDARRRRSVRIAGSSVSAEATASPTTIAPAIPTERRIMNSNRTSPSRPSSTVSPLKKTARPAVATVTRTASATAVRAVRPERELLAEPARHQQRVVDARARARAASRG